MTDYIKREDARGKLCSMCRWEGTENCGECEHPIDDILAADVAPVVRGRWVHGDYGPYCSNCDGYPPTRKRLGHPGDTEFDYTKFCPNCGAKMEV